jgi:hypothetical protein
MHEKISEMRAVYNAARFSWINRFNRLVVRNQHLYLEKYNAKVSALIKKVRKRPRLRKSSPNSG